MTRLIAAFLLFILFVMVLGWFCDQMGGAGWWSCVKDILHTILMWIIMLSPWVFGSYLVLVLVSGKWVFW